MFYDTPNVTFDQLAKLDTPEGTDTWHPVSHSVLADMVREQLPEHGLTVANERYHVSKWDKDNPKIARRMFGVFDIESEIIEGVRFQVGLRNGVDRMLSAALCFGSQVTVCSNLCFSGELVIARRHTKNIMADLPAMIQEALGEADAAKSMQAVALEAMKNAAISEEEASHRLIRAYQSGVLSKTQLADVADEYTTEKHRDMHGAGTVWSLWNAGTEVEKSRQERNLVAASGDSVRWFGHCRKLATA